LLRSIDNFQGEEAKIVILSLVRNCGTPEQAADLPRTTIGFLKVSHRFSPSSHAAYDKGYQSCECRTFTSQTWNVHHGQ
jgi:hypothetical protein